MINWRKSDGALMSKQKNETEVVHVSDEVLDSFVEAMEDMSNHHLKSAESYTELEKLLDE